MKPYLLIFIISMFLLSSLKAQTIVGTDPENKNVVLEEFTGIHCVYCPDGHAIAQSIYDAHPDDVVLINIHTGGYAVPSGSEPDFRTPWGSAIAGQTDLQGYPAGTVNRHLFSNWSQGSGTAMSRNYWTPAANLILAEPSYLNIAAEATIVTSTRQLVVYVEVYYTGDSPEESNYLNVALLQNNILGPQTGGGAGNNYNHMHMLRHLLTGQWGVEITETSQGSLYSGYFAYELPMDYLDVEVVLENLDIAAFVTETHQEVISGCLAEVSYVESNEYDAAIYSVNTPHMVCSGNISPNVLIKNYGTNSLTSLEFIYSANGSEPSSYSWTGDLAQFESTYVMLPEVLYTATDNNWLSISCESPNGQTDQLPQNDIFMTNMPGSETFPTNCMFGVHVAGAPQDVSWNIVDSEGMVLAEGGPYESQGVFWTEINFPTNDCYILTLNDESGEGLSGGFYVITDDNNDVLWMGEEFTYESVLEMAHGMIVDIDESISSDNITIYPNPVSQKANIKISSGNEVHFKVTLHDILGKQVKTIHSGTLKSGEQIIQMDASGLERGMYFVKFQTDRDVFTKKIMISK